MGIVTRVKPVKLICGFIFQDDKYLIKAKGILSRKFGKIDFESKALPFNFTDYYTREFGTDLKRVFVSFENLIKPDYLALAKIITNLVEKKLSSGGNRRINIDPGYLDSARLVLASTKDFAHRIYLNKGIFAETTLVFRDHSFRSWEWTYPDYKKEEYITIFNKIRSIFTDQCQISPRT